MARLRSPGPVTRPKTVPPGVRPLPVALALALAAAPAVADTLRPFVPGSSPCREACTLDWAADAFGVEPGEPVPMVLPAGSILGLMSYARDGAPVVDRRGFVTVEAHDGVGYRLPDGQVMFQVRACGNWTIATLPYGAASSSLASPALFGPSAGSVARPVFGGSGPGGLLVGLPTDSGGRRGVEEPDGLTPLVPEPADPGEPLIPVPLPWAGLLLAAGLGFLWRRRA